MKHPRTGHLVVLSSSCLLLAACAGSGAQHATRDLGDRLQTRLASNIAGGHATLQALPTGARVTLLNPTSFGTGGTDLTDSGNDVLAGVVQGLLDPRLMRIEVISPATATDRVQAAEVQSVTQYFEAYGLGSSLQPVAPPQQAATQPDGSAPTGLAININVQCPHYDSPAGYGTGQAEPTCD